MAPTSGAPAGNGGRTSGLLIGRPATNPGGRAGSRGPGGSGGGTGERTARSRGNGARPNPAGGADPGSQLEQERPAIPPYPSPAAQPGAPENPLPWRDWQHFLDRAALPALGLRCPAGAPVSWGLSASCPAVSHRARVLRPPSRRALTLDPGLLLGAVGGAVRHLPRAGGLHSHCPSCFQAPKGSWQHLLAAARVLGRKARPEGCLVAKKVTLSALEATCSAGRIPRR